MNSRGRKIKIFFLSGTRMNVNGTNLQFFLIVGYTWKLLPLHLFGVCVFALFMPTPDKTSGMLILQTVF